MPGILSPSSDGPQLFEKDLEERKDVFAHHLSLRGVKNHLLDSLWILLQIVLDIDIVNCDTKSNKLTLDLLT